MHKQMTNVKTILDTFEKNCLLKNTVLAEIMQYFTCESQNSY